MALHDQKTTAPIWKFTIDEALPALKGGGTVQFRNRAVTACQVKGHQISFATDSSDTKGEGFGMTERRKTLRYAKMVAGEGDIK